MISFKGNRAQINAYPNLNLTLKVYEIVVGDSKPLSYEIVRHIYRPLQSLQLLHLNQPMRIYTFSLCAIKWINEPREFIYEMSNVLTEVEFKVILT